MLLGSFGVGLLAGTAAHGGACTFGTAALPATLLPACSVPAAFCCSNWRAVKATIARSTGGSRRQTCERPSLPGGSRRHLFALGEGRWGDVASFCRRDGARCYRVRQKTDAGAGTGGGTIRAP